jgi:hypothetical protein
MAITSTIKTGIERTIRFGIWNASLQRIMLPITSPKIGREEGQQEWQDWNLPDWLRQSGMQATKESSGTNSITRIAKRSFTRRFLSYVSFADHPLRGWLGRLFAAKNAKQSTGLIVESTTKPEIAGNASGNFQSTNTSKTHIAQRDVLGKLVVVSVKEEPKADVYCLHVPSTGCFALKDGIIVSNSDAFGYYVAKEFPVADGRMRKGRARV